MARKDFGARPLSYVQPVYMIATYDENGNPDIMNAAWGGIYDAHEMFFCLTPNHKTCQNFLKTGAFTVSCATADKVVECDYLGIASANKVPDKVERSGFTVTKSEKVNAPIINELPVCIECTLKSYDPDNRRCVGTIVNVSVNEDYLDDNGDVDVLKMKPIFFDPFNDEYFAATEYVGDAFTDGNKIQ